MFSSEPSVIVWQSAHVTPTLSPFAMSILPSPLLSFGTMPMTALALISLAVVAGSLSSFDVLPLGSFRARRPMP